MCDAVNIVDITSVLTLATGYTATNRTHIFKQGKHVFGTIVIHKDSGNFGEGYEIAYMNAYRPKYQWVGLSGFGTEEWNVKSIGYAFVDSTSPGKILVSDTITTNNYVQIQIDYHIT